jgi:succinate dehydrogenase flavin-adding protein (antitoxin of CptAB toxin-antitoxin module)
MTQTPSDSAPLASAPLDEARLRKMKFRAWHRGTREADYMIGCFFDTFHPSGARPKRHGSKS